MSDTPSVTRLLVDWTNGRQDAREELMPLVYGELKALARSNRYRWNGVESLGTTSLVHEAYLKLADAEPRWQNRRHFFATAAKVMRHLLVDVARRSAAAKRGGGVEHVALRDDDAVLAQE